MTPMLAPPTVRRVLIPDAFRPARDRIIETVPWRFGGRLGDYLTPACFEAPDSLVVLRNGVRMAREDWDRQPIYPDDEVGVVLWPGTGAEILYGLWIAFTVISAIVATWSAVDGARRAKIQGHHMARRQAAMALAMSDSAVYSFDGIQNTTQPGRSILVVYGRHRVGGQVIYAEPYKDKLGKNALDVTIVLSQGEIEEVETATIEINARPLSEFVNVSVETRVGTNAQAAALNHAPGMVIKTLSNPGTEIVASGAAVTFTTQANRTNYEVDLNFPQGLAAKATTTNWNGTFAQWAYVQASFSIRHRVSPAGAWSTPVTIKSGWKWAAVNQQFALSYRSGPLTKNTYDIEVTRLANEFKSIVTSPTFAIEAGAHKSYLSSVREYDNTGLRYPNLALLYVSALASDQLNGMLPTITVIVKGRKLDIYTSAPGEAIVGPLSNGEITSATNFRVTDGHAGFTTVGVAVGDLVVITAGGTAGASVIGTFTVAAVVDQNNLTISGTFAATGTGISFSIISRLGVKTNAFSRNPAWCILDLLTHDLYGAGAHLEIGPSDGTEDTGDCDIRSFIDAAAFCDTLVPRGRTADNPIAEGATNNMATTAAGNTAFLTSGATFPAEVLVGDRLTTEGGADAGDYRIDAINAARNIATVSTVTGGTVTFTGSTLQDWHVDAMEQRNFCDYVIDGQTNVLDAASAMAKAARMELVQGFGQYSLLPDQASLPVAVFGSGNIIDGTYRHEYLAHRMLANKVEVQFLNADLNYQQDIVQLEDPAVLTNTEEVVVEPIEAYSATRFTQVQRIAKFNYLSNRYERELIEFETSIEGLPVRVFDVIAYVHELMRPGEFFSGRAAAGTTDLTLVLGQAITVPAGTVDIYVQTHTDDPVGQDVILRGTILEAAAARLDTITVTDWLDVEAGDVTVPDGPRPGDPWILVPRATPEEAQRQWKVLDVSLGQEGRRKIRAVAYREEIYDEEPVPGTLVAAG